MQIQSINHSLIVKSIIGSTMASIDFSPSIPITVLNGTTRVSLHWVIDKYKQGLCNAPLPLEHSSLLCYDVRVRFRAYISTQTTLPTVLLDSITQ